MNIDGLDIGKVQVGQSVQITADAVEGQADTGVITKVSVPGTTVDQDALLRRRLRLRRGRLPRRAGRTGGLFCQRDHLVGHRGARLHGHCGGRGRRGGLLGFPSLIGLLGGADEGGRGPGGVHLGAQVLLSH